MQAFIYREGPGALLCSKHSPSQDCSFTHGSHNPVLCHMCSRSSASSECSPCTRLFFEEVIDIVILPTPGKHPSILSGSAFHLTNSLSACPVFSMIKLPQTVITKLHLMFNIWLRTCSKNLTISIFWRVFVNKLGWLRNATDVLYDSIKQSIFSMTLIPSRNIAPASLSTLPSTYLSCGQGIFKQRVVRESALTCSDPCFLNTVKTCQNSIDVRIAQFLPKKAPCRSCP